MIHLNFGAKPYLKSKERAQGVGKETNSACFAVSPSLLNTEGWVLFLSLLIYFETESCSITLADLELMCVSTPQVPGLKPPCPCWTT